MVGIQPALLHQQCNYLLLDAGIIFRLLQLYEKAGPVVPLRSHVDILFKGWDGNPLVSLSCTVGVFLVEP